MEYVDRPALGTFPIESNTENYDKLLRRAYGSFQILQVTEYILTVDESGIANITSIDVHTIERPHRFEASKDSSKDAPTLYETDSYRKTRITPPLLKNIIKETGTTIVWIEDSYIEVKLPDTAQTNSRTSKKGIPDSKEIRHGSQKT